MQNEKHTFIFILNIENMESALPLNEKLKNCGLIDCFLSFWFASVRLTLISAKCMILFAQLGFVFVVFKAPTEQKGNSIL